MHRQFGKRLVCVGVAAAAMALGLTGCGGPSTDDSDTAATASGTDYSGIEPAKEISFWGNHPGNSIDFETKVAADFEKETGIKVNLVSAGANYDEVAQKFSTAQVSGDAGDLVVVADVTWFSLAQAGSITPVDDVFKGAGIDPSTYVDSFYADYEYEGGHYAVPYGRSDLVFYYNKDLYEKAGLDLDGPKTWEDVKKNSQAIDEYNGDAIPFAWLSDTSYVSFGVSSLLWAEGTDWSTDWDFSTMTSDPTVKAIQFAQDSVTDGWAQVTSADPSTVMAAGGVSQMISSSGGIAAIKEAADYDLGVTEVPTGSSGATDVVPTGGAGVAVNANSTPEKQLAAAMFADYLTNAENTVEFSSLTGYLPVRSDADTSTLAADNPELQVAIDSLDNARVQAYARVLVPGGPTILDKGLMKILVDGADVKTTLASMQEEIQSSYDKNVKQ